MNLKLVKASMEYRNQISDIMEECRKLFWIDIKEKDV